MPKFNAARERARATRHNPLHRVAGQGVAAGSSEGSDLRTVFGQGGDDLSKEAVIPILRHLPLPSDHQHSSPSTISKPGEVFWALTSLTSLLSHKPSRNVLLAPLHDVVSRILNVLDPSSSSSSSRMQAQIEIRDAASGCLRNICVEAGHKARRSLEAKGATKVVLEQIKLTAVELGLMEGVTQEGNGTINGKTTLVDSSHTNPRKPFDEMNKKERRHFMRAKAKEEIETKHRLNGEQEMEDVQGVEEEKKDDDEIVALSFSHLANLVTILWCLVEISQAALEACDSSAPMLSQVFAKAVSRATQAGESLASNQSKNVASTNTNVADKDRAKRNMVVIDAGISSLNALVALCDSDASFSAAFVGISEQELRLALRQGGKRFNKARGVLLAQGQDQDQGLDATRQAGRGNIGALTMAVHHMQTALSSYNDDRLVHRQAVSLGLLSLAALRSLQSSVPRNLRAKFRLPLGDNQNIVFIGAKEFEAEQSLPSLLKVLRWAQTRGTSNMLDGYSDMSTVDKSANGEGEASSKPQARKSKRATEDLHNTQLALEVLAELINDVEAWPKNDSERQGEDDEAEADDGIEVDEEGDEAMLTDDVSVIENGADEETTIEQEASLQADFSKTPIAQLFTTDVAELLLSFADLEKITASYPSISSNARWEGATSLGSSLRSLSIRALSVLNNIVLVVSSAAPPPPSQPLTRQWEIERRDSFQLWLSQESVRSACYKLWTWSFELASQVASTPAVSHADDPSQSEAEAEESRDSKATVETCLGIMWSLGRCLEETPGDIASKVLPLDAGALPAESNAAKAGPGVVHSLIAAYRSSKSTTVTVQEAASAVNDIGPPVITPTTDGLRVRSLGALCTIARKNALAFDMHKLIISFLCDVVDAVPLAQSTGRAGSESKALSLGFTTQTSADGLVVALNGIIDTYADETKPWDHAYEELSVGSKLRACLPRIRAAVRAIDKRKQAALRSNAEETVENLLGFLQYRDKLR